MAAAIEPSASLTLPRPVTCLAALPDTAMVAAGLASGHVVLWNGRDPTPAATLTPHKARVLAVGAARDGRDVLSVAVDATLARSPREPGAAGIAARVELPAGPPPREAVFSPDGALVAIGGEFGDIHVHDARSGALERALRGHRAELTNLAVRPGSSLLASAAADADLRVWDLASGAQTGFADTDLTTLAVAFSPKDGTLAAGGTDRRLTLRDSTTMATIGVFELRAPKMVAALAWSPDGRLIAVGDLDDETLRKGGLQIVDAATRQSLAVLETGGAPARLLAFLLDGRLVAQVDRELRAWDVRT
jgi:WD40 repeat protein